MKRTFSFLSTIILLCGAFVMSESTALIEQLKNTLYAYSQESPVHWIYLHLDKNIFQPGETIWLKAYMKTTSQIKEEALYVRIVNRDQKVIIEKEFLAYDAGAHGDITLPDSLEQGDYHVLAYSDKMMNFEPDDAFVQTITVIDSSGMTLTTGAFVADSTMLQPNRTVEIICKVTRNGRAVDAAKGSFKVVTSNNKQVADGRLTTDQHGQVSVLFKYPQILPADNLKVTAEFLKEKTRGTLSIVLPPQQRRINIQVHAEGGRLISGVPCKLLIQTSDETGNPQPCQVMLRTEDDILSTITTDSKGQGVIILKADQSKNYSFRLKKGLLIQESKLPVPIETSGWGLRLNRAERNLLLTITNRNMPDSATLVMRSMGELLWHKLVSVKSGDSLLIKLPTVDTSKRTLSLALFSNRGKVYNERLFLTRKEENYHVDFHLSKTKLGPREKVKVTLKVTNSEGKAISSNLSVAAVVDKALDKSTYNTILNYQDVFSGSSITRSTPEAASLNLDDAMIGCGWKRNNWVDITTFHPKGKVALLANSAGLVGIVKNKRKKERPFKGVFLFGASGNLEIPIQPNGMFSIPAEDLVANAEKQNYIFVDNDFNNNFLLQLKNYNTQFEERIKATGKLKSREDYVLENKAKEIMQVNGAIQLKEVLIQSTNKLDSLSLLRLIRNYPNNCRDYVCDQGVLNCKRHHVGSRPVIGMFYKYNGDPSYTYTKCLNCCLGESNNYSVKSISVPRSFPFKNYDTDNSPIPEYLSTIYWNPNLNTNVDGKVSFEFYTSDLKGTYKIIVQGLEATQLLPVYGTAAFSVE